MWDFLSFVLTLPCCECNVSKSSWVLGFVLMEVFKVFVLGKYKMKVVWKKSRP
jgi:hypothetical protein